MSNTPHNEVTIDDLLIKRFQFGVNIGRGQGGLEPTYPMDEILDMSSARAALTTLIDDIVAEVIGEYYPFSPNQANSKDIEISHKPKWLNELKLEQRQRYAELKKERGM